MKQNIPDIVQEVARLSPHKRSQFFRAVFDNNPALAEAIQLQLETTDQEHATQTMVGDQDWFPEYTEDLIGKKIGSYLIEKRLGEGGMGFVFLGTQEEPIRRKVALKILKPGITSHLSPRRFLAERQALAMMNHHHIAKILDAGMTQEGLPYFAMEYIDGKNITHYCDDHELSMEKRIVLFIQLCDAIQHANQNGILHRDLKPSNILVTETEDGPVVKVIDFGIAKSIKTSLTDETFQTELGRVMGTLQYMSPEQMNPDTQGIDTRSDVYTLGILLQELLSGVRPFDVRELEKRDFFSVQQHVLYGDPIKPSIRLTSKEPETLQTLAQSRSLSVKEFKKFLCGDLDWIILKAQAKSREERYVSAHNLKVELQRYLTNQPVLAGPPNMSYRLKKFAKRHRLAMAFSSMLLLTLIIAFFGVSYGLVKARKAHVKSQATIELLKEFLISPTPAQEGSDLKVSTLLEKFEPKLQDIQDHDIRVDLHHTVATAYANLGNTSKAITIFETILESLDHSKKSDRLWIAQIKNILYSIKAKEQPNQQMRDEIFAFLETCRHWFGDTHKETQIAELNHALIHSNMGHFELAYQFSRDLLTKSLATLGKQNKNTLTAMMVLGHSLMALDRVDESIEIQEQLLELAQAADSEDSSFVLIARGNLANAYDDKCLFQKAWALREESYQLALVIFGERHPQTVWFRRNLSYSQNELGYFQDALAMADKNLNIEKEIHGPNHYNTMFSKFSKALILYNSEDYEAALSLQSQCRKFFHKELGPRNPVTLVSDEVFAAILACMGEVDRALVIQENIVKIRTEDFGIGNRKTIYSQAHLEMLKALKDPIPSLAQFDQYFATFSSISSQMELLEDLIQLLETSKSKIHLGPYYAKYLRILENTGTIASPIAQKFLKNYYQFALNHEPTRAMELSAKLETK